ncbi:hypothetical protein RHMOL_Rhmol01G0098500 [Rhododendron molle]|uniref:Uncharacterized protein n=1 Tax=Rhododendron molle TaxID=49168 RepID=A0ACC0Q341_RHOML|nr:hypothetical protein RHMOL_Rhmol01G0098500 [Rhododendron molle]
MPPRQKDFLPLPYPSHRNGYMMSSDDKELERGEFISDGLLKAIEGSKISLIVFSKDYAGLRWCLDELVKIMDCRKTLKQIVMPIFYEIVPSDVRKQMGVLEEAFAEHEKCFREGSDGKVKKWRAALTKPANLSGIEVIKKTAFGRKKVLLVLDDVDKVQQLEALAIDRESLTPGSRIIITTRDKSSLKILELGENEIYGLEKLDKDESLELFSWHAFKEDQPPEDHLDLSRQIGHYAGGLPLALEVLGSYFRGKSIPQWKSAIVKLRKIPDDDVRGKLNISLMISFDSLSEQLKKLFQALACFFVGIGRDFTAKILAGYNIFAEDGIPKLADRCLIKYDCHDQIVMHDLIRDMGKEIIRQESPEDPGKRSRLWYLHDVLEVLRDGTGIEAVKGLILNATDVQVNAKPFEKMDKLWYREHVLEVWRDGMENNICTIPNSISNLPCLEQIWLNNCAKLRSLPKLPRCSSVDAVCCPSLESLPFELDQLGQGMVNYSYSVYSKLAENNFLTSLLKQLPKSKPNVSFVVPPSPSPSVKQKMLGWIPRVLFWAPREAPYQGHNLYFKEVICNKIKKEGLFPFFAVATDVDHVWLLYIPDGYGGLQLEGSDEVEIPIYATHPIALVKNWAIDLIYEADEIHKGTDTWCQVVSI